MRYIKLLKILQNHRYTPSKTSSQTMVVSLWGRQFTTESTSPITMKLAYDLYSPPADSKEDLPPVILLHSLLNSRKTWKFIAPEIAKRTGRKVYAVDARNHGESPYCKEISFDLLTEDLDAFLTQHNIPKATLVGHSMGGRTSLTFALKKPEKVDKLVVEEMHTKNFRPGQDGPIMQCLRVVQNSLRQLPADADESELRKVFSKIVNPLVLGDHSKIAEINKNFDTTMLPFKKDNGSVSSIANLDAVENFLTTNNICQNLNGTYLGDVLFLYGTKSFFRVDADPRILEYFPRAKLLAIKGGSHLIHFEYPQKFAVAVANFVNGFNNLQQK